MKILGIDTSSPSGSVALLDGNNLVSESLIEGSPAYSDKLLFEIDSILNGSGTKLNEIDGFVITTGPGSFTGLRVGISLLKGFILATEKPFASVNTLEAYANTIQPGPYTICPVLDARKKEVYITVFRHLGKGCSIVALQAYISLVLFRHIDDLDDRRNVVFSNFRRIAKHSLRKI